MTIFTKKLWTGIVAIFTLLLPKIAAGQNPATQSFSFDDPLSRYGMLTNLVTTVTFWAINVALPILVIVIVWAGFKFLTSKGSPEKVGEAKKMLWWAIIGLAIIVIGSGFIDLIQSILNLSP